MIGSLRGALVDLSPRGEVLVEVAGVGYRVQVPSGRLGQLGERGSTVFLHVHTHVREDAIVLYGFVSLDERSCFEALLGTHGVGPAVALAILSVHSPSSLRRAVAADDVDALTMVPGIGKKTAARLLLELKSRLEVADEGPELAVVGSGPAGTGPVGEVRAALAALGYGVDEVRVAVRSLPAEGSTEELLRRALRELAVARL
ncbi:MAG: Holliday junction branch migration protein RuvA [Actinobacteria bacterium]|nr:Holliday junction branch migration protein RuvA [Actinomycetota bacterium]MBW3649525.1 Holliday junction branch migration protein RuvA [Actinomycetota bacterium]